MRKASFKWPFFLFVLILLVVSIFVAWREYMIWCLPFDEVELATLENQQKLEIPPRPGIQGIVVTGPVIESLSFAIDVAGGARELDWRRLNAIDSHADVRIHCIVNDQGELTFSQNDVLMGGHTEAGLLIQQAIKTWTYMPYKTGVIRFWFNLPSRGNKLEIDVSGLKRKADIPDFVPLFDGRLHLVDGVPPGQVQVKTR
jgi:hypothetical protein